MKIQFGHGKKGNFREDFYAPLKKYFPEIQWIFPHEREDTKIVSEQSLKEVDIFLAEVSQSATGLGIELGFAKIHEKRIVCIYKQGSEISSSLKYITNEFIPYSSQEDMIAQLSKIFTP